MFKNIVRICIINSIFIFNIFSSNFETCKPHKDENTFERFDYCKTGVRGLFARPYAHAFWERARKFRNKECRDIGNLREKLFCKRMFYTGIGFGVGIVLSFTSWLIQCRTAALIVPPVILGSFVDLKFWLEDRKKRLEKRRQEIQKDKDDLFNVDKPAEQTDELPSSVNESHSITPGEPEGLSLPASLEDRWALFDLFKHTLISSDTVERQGKSFSGDEERDRKLIADKRQMVLLYTKLWRRASSQDMGRLFDDQVFDRIMLLFNDMERIQRYDSRFSSVIEAHKNRLTEAIIGRIKTITPDDIVFDEAGGLKPGLVSFVFSQAAHAFNGNPFTSIRRQSENYNRRQIVGLARDVLIDRLFELGMDTRVGFNGSFAAVRALGLLWKANNEAVFPSGDYRASLFSKIRPIIFMLSQDEVGSQSETFQEWYCQYMESMSKNHVNLPGREGRMQLDFFYAQGLNFFGNSPKFKIRVLKAKF